MPWDSVLKCRNVKELLVLKNYIDIASRNLDTLKNITLSVCRLTLWCWLIIKPYIRSSSKFLSWFRQSFGEITLPCICKFKILKLSQNLCMNFVGLCNRLKGENGSLRFMKIKRKNFYFLFSYIKKLHYQLCNQKMWTAGIDRWPRRARNKYLFVDAHAVSTRRILWTNQLRSMWLVRVIELLPLRPALEKEKYSASALKTQEA